MVIVISRTFDSGVCDLFVRGRSFRTAHLRVRSD
jgi:hypothetical protein